MSVPDDLSPQNTIFGKIVRGEVPSAKVFENEHALAFRDIQPQAPTHILVIPKVPVRDIMEADPEMIGHLFAAVQDIVRDQGLEQDGFRVVINTGQKGGQTVFYLHVHILGGRNLGWPPG